MPRAFSRARAIMLRIDCGLVRSKVRIAEDQVAVGAGMCRVKRLAAGEDVQRDLDRRRAVFDGQGRCVELEKEPDVEQAGHVFGTLEVAAHPEEVFGDAAEHLRSSRAIVMARQRPAERAAPSCRTQVSLVPPPCELLTTRLPSGRATRVSPPGMTTMSSP